MWINVTVSHCHL